MPQLPQLRDHGPTVLDAHHPILSRRRFGALMAAGALLASVALPGAVAARASSAGSAASTAAFATATPDHHRGRNEYRQTNLLSDIPGVARNTDPNLVNPWGMAAGPTTPIWVSDNGTDKTTLYSGAIAGSPLLPAALVVGIPNGEPTGQVFNPSTDFVVSNGAAHGAALFIFASESGSITGWNPGVPAPAPSTSAQVGITVPDAVYKGLAITTGSHGDFLYAANFHSGTIDVFNGSYQLVHRSGSFTDPSLPSGYAPFNIQNIGGRLYVTYAKQDAAKHDDVAGAGHGFVDVFDLRGHLVQRLVSRGQLNSPWGLAIAPSGFGRFSGDLLVGNFGDGTINAYNPNTGHFIGQLKNEDGNVIAINGLWGLRFGNGTAGSATTLVFTAGIADEAHGLMGTIEAVK
jgi:uncharacterized protein (TIGR03118 family)